MHLRRPVVADARYRVAKNVRKVLLETAAKVRSQLETMLKADEIEIDLSGLDGIDDATRAEIVAVAGSSGKLVIGQLGFSDSNMFGQIDDRVAAWAADNAAELVTQVTDTTREKLRALIADGIADGLTREEIISDMMDSYSFSEERAALIADTEIGFANSAGSLMGLQEAEDAGVNVKKEWDATDEPCPICQGNQAVGAIPLDATFPSGDDAPLAHPNCRCVLVGVTE